MDNLLKKNKITDREKEVLMLTIKGLSNSEIAEELTISVHTVKAHLESIYRKLNVHNKVQASVSAVYNNFINIEDVF